MRSNQALIEHMVARGLLKSPAIIDAFKVVDRKHFVPQTLEKDSYLDIPLSIGEDQTISQPSTVAFMLELLNVKKGDKVLDIGSGSGWSTALLAYLVGDKGSVLGLERVPTLQQIGAKNLAKFPFPWAKIELAKPAILGMPSQQFNAILVSASAKKIPTSLFDQLHIGARLVIPIKESIFLFEKYTPTQIREQEFKGFRFVPLIV